MGCGSELEKGVKKTYEITEDIVSLDHAFSQITGKAAMKEALQQQNRIAQEQAARAEQDAKYAAEAAVQQMQSDTERAKLQAEAQDLANNNLASGPELASGDTASQKLKKKASYQVGNNNLPKVSIRV